MEDLRFDSDHRRLPYQPLIISITMIGEAVWKAYGGYSAPQRTRGLLCGAVLTTHSPQGEDAVASNFGVTAV